MDRRMLFAGLLVVLIATVLFARPGSLTTLDGDTFKGEITEKGDSVSIDQHDGKPPIQINKQNVRSYTWDPTIDEQYKTRYAKLDAKDVKGRIALAAWATDHDRSDLAVTVLTEARSIDPMNQDAAKALDAAQSQLDLDNKSKARAATTGPAVATTGPTGAPAAPATAPARAAAHKMGPRRLLTADEINTIRQHEMPTDDPKVTIRFENQVVKKYLAAGNHDAAVFNKEPVMQQALEIIAAAPELAKDVKIVNDPPSIIEFRSKVMPVIAVGCASTSCHGGDKAGRLQFFKGGAAPDVYTNFYILQTYSTDIGGVKYLTMDRSTPDNSLVLQFGLPLTVGKPAHKAVAGMHPRFKSVDDPAYKTVSDYIRNMSAIQPDYGIDVSPYLPGPDAGPTSRPADAAPAAAPAGPAPAAGTPVPAVGR